MKLAQLSPLLFSFSLAGCGGGAATPIDGPSSADAPVDAAVKTVEVTLVDPPADVAAAGLTFAYQDGDGAWQKAPTPVGGKITLTLSNEKYGFAADCVFNDFHAVETRYATVTDTPAFSQTLEGCTTAPTLAGMMTGQIITLGDSKHALAHGSSQAKLTTVGMQTLPYSFAVAPGTADVLLARSTAATLAPSACRARASISARALSAAAISSAIALALASSNSRNLASSSTLALAAAAARSSSSARCRAASAARRSSARAFAAATALASCSAFSRAAT